MLEKILGLFERLIIAAESIAKSLEGASIKSATSAPATAPAAAAPPATTTVDDDLGLGPSADKLTKEKVMEIARETANARGRDTVKAALKKLKCDTVKDLKEDQYQAFADSLKVAS